MLCISRCLEIREMKMGSKVIFTHISMEQTFQNSSNKGNPYNHNHRLSILNIWIPIVYHCRVTPFLEMILNQAFQGTLIIIRRLFCWMKEQERIFLEETLTRCWNTIMRIINQFQLLISDFRVSHIITLRIFKRIWIKEEAL